MVHNRHAATVCIYRFGTHANARLVLNLQRYALRVFADARIAHTLAHYVGFATHLHLLVRLSGSAVLGRQSQPNCAGHANETLVRIFLEHCAVMRATFVRRLRLVYLHLLHSTETVFGPRVAMPCSLRTRYEVLPASGLHVATSR